MNLAILRVEGNDTELQNLRDSLSLFITASWKKGEPKILSGNYNQSGFNASISDTETPNLLIKELREFLVKCKVNESVFINSDLSTQLDLGIGVGSSGQFAASVTLTPTDLKYFSELGIELNISAYPISSDEE